MSNPDDLHVAAFDVEILKALRVDGDLVSKISLVMEGNRPTQVHITRFVTNAEMALIRKAMGHFELVPAQK